MSINWMIAVDNDRNDQGIKYQIWYGTKMSWVAISGCEMITHLVLIVFNSL